MPISRGHGPGASHVVGLYASQPQAPSVVEEDDSDSWWGGVNFSGVGVAIAGLATALAVSTATARTFNLQDEVAQAVTAPAIDARTTTLRAQSFTTFQRWAQPDELPVLVPQEDDSWSPTRQQAPPVIPTVWADDDLPVTPPAQIIDDDTWQPPVVVQAKLQTLDPNWDSDALFWPIEEADWQGLACTQPGLRYPPPWADDDFAQTAATIVEEDLWLNPRAFLIPPIVQTFGDADMVPTPAAVTVADGSTGFAQRLRSETQFKFWPQGDELPTPTATLGVEDDAAFLGKVAGEITVIVWAENEDTAPPATALGLDEDYWIAPPVPLAGPTLRKWIDEEIVPRAQVEDEFWQQPYSVPVYPFLKLWTDQDETVTPPTPLAADEDYWLTLRGYDVPAIATLFQAEDEAMDWYAPPVEVTPDKAAHWPKKRRRPVDDSPEVFEPERVIVAPPAFEPSTPVLEPRAPKPATLETLRMLAEQLAEQRRKLAELQEQKGLRTKQAVQKRIAAIDQRAEQVQQEMDDETRAQTEDDALAAAIAAALLLDS